MEETKKKCTCCLIEKDRTDFSKQTSRKDGLSSSCRLCKNSKAKVSDIKNRDRKIKYMQDYNKKTKEKRAAYYKIYGQENKEIISQRNKEHYEKNIDRYKEVHKIYYSNNKERYVEVNKIWRGSNKTKIAEKNKIWYNNNREKIAEVARIWYHNNKEKAAETHRIWYDNNKVKKAEKGKQWRSNNKAKVTEMSAKRRAHILKNGIFYISEKEITKLLSSNCYICQANPSEHLDHIVPISKGGTHSIGNLLGACQRCNLEKGSKTLYEYKRQRATREVLRPL